MALLPVNDDALPDDVALTAALSQIADQAPVVILIHGFRFNPYHSDHDPHGHILSLTPDPRCWKAVSWPRHLRLADNRGLAIGFGWRARGTIWQAHARAAQSGARLARLIAALRRVAPDRPVHLFAHSLGARVALTALPRLDPGAVDRIILISAACFQSEARRSATCPAGRAAEIINILGRENTAFDLLLRVALPLRGPTAGRGLKGLTNWLDLRLDGTANLLRLRQLGHRICPARVTVCHWSGYLRPGVFGFYRALLRPPEMPLALLRAQLAPPPAPAINRRLRSIIRVLPLPFGRQTPF